jgi:hypothetical protein
VRRAVKVEWVKRRVVKMGRGKWERSGKGGRGGEGEVEGEEGEWEKHFS